MIDYNTDINIIGSIADLELIFDVIRNEGKFAKDCERMALIRTEKSKSRIFKGIQSVFLSFTRQEQEEFIKYLNKQNFTVQFQSFILFLQFSISNTLFYEINCNVLVKSVRMGKISLRTNEIAAYIHALKETSAVVKSWSESTIDNIAVKYISFLRKLGFVNKGRANELIYFYPSEEMVIAFIYLIKAIEPNLSDIFKSKYIDLIFIKTPSLLDIVKSIRMKEFMNIATTGGSLQVELKYNFTEVVDALSKRYKTKI